MLNSRQIVAFVPTKHVNEARAFYKEILGLRFVSEDSFALMFDANGTMLRVSIVPDFKPHPSPFWVGKFPTSGKRFPNSTQKESLSSILGSRNKMCRESGQRPVGPKWHGSRTPMGMS